MKLKQCPKCGNKFSVIDVLRLNFKLSDTCSKCGTIVKFKTIPYAILHILVIAVMGVFIVQVVGANGLYIALSILGVMIIDNILLLFIPLEEKK